MDKIMYFTAGTVPTTEELAEIAALNAKAAAPYEIAVRDGSGVRNFGTETADYAAGTIPDVTPYNGYTVFDIDNEPVAVNNEDTITISNSAGDDTVEGTAAIDTGELTIELASTVALVATNETVVVKNSAGTVSKNGTATVASGAITGVALASSVALVTSGDTKTGVTGSGTTATITVTNGVISGIALS